MSTARTALVGEGLPVLDAEVEEVGLEVHRTSLDTIRCHGVKHFLVSGPCSTRQMNDDALIRLANLKALNLTPKDLSDRIGGRVSYWADLLRGQKSFGEKAARKIEEQLGIPRMSLDTADAEAPLPTPQPARPEADQLANALEVLTKTLLRADEDVRLSVEPLLASLAREPAKASNKSRLILRLLFTDNVQPVPADNERPGHISGDLGILNLGDEAHGRRDRVAAKGGSKG